MRRCLVLLLIIETVWAQTDFDKLVLKDGTEYIGKYLRTEKRLVYFNHHKSKNVRLARIISIQDVSTLQLSDGGSVDFESYKKNYPKEYKNSKFINLAIGSFIIVSIGGLLFFSFFTLDFGPSSNHCCF